jgi:hypothetical protein
MGWIVYIIAQKPNAKDKTAATSEHWNMTMRKAVAEAFNEFASTYPVGAQISIEDFESLSITVKKILK